MWLWHHYISFSRHQSTSMNAWRRKPGLSMESALLSITHAVMHGDGEREKTGGLAAPSRVAYSGISGRGSPFAGEKS